MPDSKLFAGHAIRKLRRGVGQTQGQMAAILEISPSYLNLIERNQRPLTAAILLRLAERYDFDARSLSGSAPGGGAEAMRRRLADPLFADLALDRSAIDEWMMAHPDAAEAFARAFDRTSAGQAGETVPETLLAVRREIERWRNHFSDLDAQAELLADELRQSEGELSAALADRLRSRHKLAIRVLPIEAMPDQLRRLDLDARQLQLSERLDAASRNFAAAFQLAQLEAVDEIDALVRGASFVETASERLYRRHLLGYFAAAVMMPYSRFFRACEASGYDLPLLQRRFGVGFEMLAHRLTTLHRLGARGLAFFMIRFDRAGQLSKRYAGASGFPLDDSPTRCPLWNVHRAFDAGGEILVQHIELEDGSRWVTLARSVHPHAAIAGSQGSEFVIALGVAASEAQRLVAIGKRVLEAVATPIGLGCTRCLRSHCAQRGLPPAGRELLFNDRERGLSPFSFEGRPASP